MTVRWQLTGEELVPLTINDTIDDRIDVQMSMRYGSTYVSFGEIWRMSTLTR